MAMELIAGPPAGYLAADDVVQATAPEVHVVPAAGVVAALRRGELAVEL